MFGKDKTVEMHSHGFVGESKCNLDEPCGAMSDCMTRGAVRYDAFPVLEDGKTANAVYVQHTKATWDKRVIIDVFNFCPFCGSDLRVNMAPYVPLNREHAREYVADEQGGKANRVR